MKLQFPLALSVLLNAWLLSQHYRTKTEGTPSRAPQPPTVNLTQAVHAGEGSTGTPGCGCDWRALESVDYRKYIDNLRAIRCPAQTVCDIVVADVRNLISERRREVLHHTAGDETRRRLELAALDDWESRTLDSLLGPTWRNSGAAPSETVANSGRLDFLDASKALAVTQLEERYESMMVEAGSTRSTSDPRGHRARILQLEAELNEALASLLNTAEHAAYARLHDPEAAALVAGGFKFTDDEEFLRVLAARRRATLTDRSSNATQSGMEDEIQTILGPSRYQQYLRANDSSCRAITNLGERLGLSPAIVDQVLEVRDHLNRTLRDGAIAASVAADMPHTHPDPLEEAEDRIRALLGPIAYQGWLNAGLKLTEAEPSSLQSPEPSPTSTDAR